jgi:hypothetical protein
MATYNTPIIPASDKDSANAFWEDAGAGPNTFSVGLVPADGPSDATITHYFASGQFERYFPSAYTEFPVQFPNAVLLRHVGNSSTNYAYVESELASRNLKRYSPIV